MELTGRLIHMMLVVLLVSGLVILFRHSFWIVMSLMNARRRLYKRRRAENRSALMKNLDLLVKVTVNKNLAAEGVLICSIILFIAALSTGLRSVGSPYAFVAAFIFALMPYPIMKIKLENMRRRNSYEGESFLAALLSAYRMSFGNISAALEQLADDERTPTNCRRLLPEIIIKMRASGNTGALKNCAEGLSYAINTNWSRMTAYNIGIAAATGTDISLALENILSQLKEARSLAEERKRLNSESVRLAIVMIPTAYLGTLLLSVKYLDVDIGTLFYNQFLTPQGFTLITVSFFMFIFNAALLSAVNNKQFDF